MWLSWSLHRHTQPGSFYTHQRCEENYGLSTQADFSLILIRRTYLLQIINLDQILSPTVPVCTAGTGLVVVVSAQGFSRHGEYSYNTAAQPAAQLGSWQLAAGKAGGGENVECCQTGCDAGTDYQLLATGVALSLIRDN